MDLIDILLSKKFNKGSGGTTNYLQLINKPKINNVELNGNKTAQDLGLVTQSDLNGKVDDVQINGTSILSEGVANIPIAGSNVFGVVKVGDNLGLIRTNNGEIAINRANSSDIKNATDQAKPITSLYQHESTFYGLAKAAGDTTQPASGNHVGTYTDEAKAAIKSMLGVADGGGMNIVNLSGTQITQVGADNTFYVCGELTELTFTAPAVGITMIRFTSGTTPTVLTISGVTAWMFDFDPTVLEANTTYDISVLNGIGVAGWA